jgi:hypothetical protein
LSPDEDAEWDDFAGRHPLGLVYHLSAWKDMLELAFPHIRGHYVVLRDKTSGKIRAGLPVYTVKSWLLGNRLVSVPFASFCDPLVSSVAEFREFLPEINTAFAGHDFRPLSIRTRTTSQEFAASLGAPESAYKHHYLALDKNPDQLFASFAKSSVRQKVTKAINAGVTVTKADGPDCMKTCHAILAQTRRKVSLPPFPLSFFSAMARFLAQEHLQVFLAIHRGKPVGCHLVLTYKDLWISEYSGNTEDAIHGVNQLLYWETIKQAHAAGARAFSFGRTSATNEGLLEYKRRWATVEEDIGDFTVPASETSQPSPTQRGASREDGKAYRVLRFLMRRAPVPVGDAIGDFCYRHLG